MSFWLIIHLALVISIVFLEQKNPAEALLWLMVVLLLPGIGVLLYLIFGSTMGIKLTNFFRSKKLDHHIDLPLHASLEQMQNVEALAQMQLSQRDKSAIRLNINHNQSPLVFCDYPQILPTGASHYKALFEDIRNAKKQILIEFYTIHNDHVGHALVELLTEKAKQGVEVKVLFDFLANITSPPKMFRSLQEAGGEVYRLKPFFTHFRSHRKIVAVDEEIGYIGGMNIGKQYINLGKKKKPWRDTQVRITGTGVAMLRYYFFKDWACTIPRRDFKALEKKFNQLELHHTLDFTFQPGQVPCQFVVGGVESTNESIKTCYLSLIRSAHHHIRIQSPYFIPDASVLDALKVAVASGIEVELMLPGISASFFLTPVTRWYLGQLMAFGAKVYLYNGYMHAKTMIIDDEIVCIGSVNLDERSLLVDDEICGLFYDNSFTAEYTNIFKKDIQHSIPYTYEQFQARGLVQRVQERVFLLFAPLM